MKTVIVVGAASFFLGCGGVEPVQDAGEVDAGPTLDAGAVSPDAGPMEQPDAGLPDAGPSPCGPGSLLVNGDFECSGNYRVLEGTGALVTGPTSAHALEVAPGPGGRARFAFNPVGPFDFDTYLCVSAWALSDAVVRLDALVTPTNLGYAFSSPGDTYWRRIPPLMGLRFPVPRGNTMELMVTSTAVMTVDDVAVSFDFCP